MATTSYTYEEMLKQIEAAMANPGHISYQGPNWQPGGSMADPIPPWQDPNQAPQGQYGGGLPNNFLPGTDVSRVAGFYNPDNPFDTGRAGEKNPERARASGDELFEDVPWWDYDAQRPKDSSIQIDPRTGYYNPGNWSANQAGGGTAQTGGPAYSGGGSEYFMGPTSGAELGAAGAPPGSPQQLSAGGPTAWAAQMSQGGPQAPPGLKQNVQLPQHPLGAFADAKYEAETAMLRADISKAYNDVLSQLGYVDPATGNVIQGTVEIEGERKQRELERGQGLAGEEVTKQKQQQGTLFSGIRATDTARAQHPFVEGIANLGVDIPRQLWSLYGKATGHLDDYSRRQNMLIAEAAERAAERARLSARATGGGGSWSGGGGAGQGTEGPNDAEPPLGWGVLGAGGTTSADDMAKWAAAAGFGWDPSAGDWRPVSSGIRGSEAYPINGPYIGTGVSGQGRP